MFTFTKDTCCRSCQFVDVCLFIVRFDVPVYRFSVMQGRKQNFLGIIKYFRECLAQGYNTVPPMEIEPRTSRFGVRRATILCFNISST